MTSKIGLFAGVFDPIHLGHTQFIKKALKDYALDKVYILVEEEPKYKTCLAGYEHRKAMVELAITDIPNVEFYPSPSKFFPITSTLPRLRKSNPAAKFFLLLGDDVAEHIRTWPDSDKLLEEVELIIASRKGSEPYSEVSSLKIRRKLAGDGSDEAIDPRVSDYCRDNRLY